MRVWVCTQGTNLLPVCPAWLRTNPPPLGVSSPICSGQSLALLPWVRAVLQGALTFLMGGRQGYQRAEGREPKLLAFGDIVQEPKNSCVYPLRQNGSKGRDSPGVTLPSISLSSHLFRPPTLPCLSQCPCPIRAPCSSAIQVVLWSPLPW